MVSSCFLKFQTPKPKTSWRLAEVIWFVCSSMFQHPYLKCCPIDCYIFGAAQPQTISSKHAHMDELILVIYVCWNISWYPLYISMFVDFGWKQFRINMYAWKCGRLTPNLLLYVLGKLLKTKHTQKKKTVRSHWNSENMGLFYLVFFFTKNKTQLTRPPGRTLLCRKSNACWRWTMTFSNRWHKRWGLGSPKMCFRA